MTDETNHKPHSVDAPDAGPTVYFDGSCPLCSVEIDHYAGQKGGKALCFVDVSQGGAPLGNDLAPDAAMKRFHVRLADGTLLSGARAFIAVWDSLPGWRWAARIANVPGMPTFLEGAYRLFLPLRPLLSRLARRCGAKPRHDMSVPRQTS